MKIGSDGLKRCSKCGEFKIAGAFSKHGAMTDGLHPECKVCQRAQERVRYATPEYRIKKLARARARRSKPAYRERQRRRRGRDAQFRLTANLRARLSTALTNGQKRGSAVRDLGCSVEDLKKWLESKFEEGMSWANYGRGGWEIDHVKPLASFDLEDLDQFKAAVNFKNLQPLWATENRAKQDKLNWTKKEKS